MTIKIWWANLIKRYINWQSIKKVMYNWQQIWGEWIIPPPVDYHIIGDFQGWMPSGWTSTWGTVSGGWLRNWGARWNQMPDLTNAIRIKIVYNIDVDWDSELSWEIKRGDNTYYGTTMGNDGWLTQNLHSLFFPYENTSETFTSFPAWTYIITADMDLIALTAIQELECPPLGHVENSEISITQEDVNLIRTWKVFDIFANASTVVHKIDFYVWYWHSEQQWIPEGYAMPTASAYEELQNKLEAMWIHKWNFYIVLHMPLVGFWSYQDTSRNSFWESTFMWTMTPSNGGSTSWCIGLYDSYMFPGDWRGYWQPVRAFKDEYIAPDSTWVVEHWSLWWAWVFWNQRLWLISVTDWADYNITMSDKNLWATIAWSYWDELVDANCWLYYQWWNCYGFSFTWWFTTDTQCVDTTGYWYWNYYSRAVYVLWSDWSCNRNDWLWDPNPYTPVSWISLQEAWQTITLQPWQTYQLHASVTPSNASNKRITYSVSGDTWAWVSETWLITIPSSWATSWTGTVYAMTLEWGYTSTCTLVVDNPTPVIPVTWISMLYSWETITLWLWERRYLRAHVIPENATNQAIIYSTSNDDITVSEYWEVKPKYSATDWETGTITATAQDWWYSASCDVIVDGSYIAPSWIGCYDWENVGKIEQWWSMLVGTHVTPNNASANNNPPTYGIHFSRVPWWTFTYSHAEGSYHIWTLSIDSTVPVWESITVGATVEWMGVTSYFYVPVVPSTTVPYHTATWKNHDWTVLETTQVLEWETPLYHWTTPDYYNGEPSIEDYVFNWWSPTPGPIYSDTTYWATYRSLNGEGPDIEPI